MWPTKSYANDVYPVFQNAGCGSSSCHGGSRPAEGLDLSTASTGYSLLVNHLSAECTNKLRVAPGDIAGSYLMNKLTGSGMCSGSQMPKTATSLTQSELDTVQAWIGSGAAQ